MRFLPKTTCEKLVKMGCVSKSGQWHDFPICGEKIQPAFTLEDLVSTDEYAKENCRKLFGEREVVPYDGPRFIFNTLKNEGWEQSRHQLIDSKDWVEFISKAVEGYEKRKEK